MKFITKTARQALNKAYIRQPVERASFEEFTSQLRTLCHVIDEAEQAGETEEHFKGDLKAFLQQTHFGVDYYINTKGDIDLAIHPESKTEPVGVLLELKRPSNKSGMVSADKPNAKALHEAVLYYLRERLKQENSDIRQVVITNLNEWFIIDSQEFERHFFRDKRYRKLYNEWSTNRKVSGNTDFFYEKVSEMIEASGAEITATHLKLDDYREQLFSDNRTEEDEKALIPLYKVLSSVHLLKEPFANDSNTLDKQFYNELLHIIGLEEVKEGSQKLIRRVDKESRNHGSLIENTIANLQAANSISMVDEPAVRYGEGEDEQYYNLALELCILWINRVLFLKLLEAQLFRYHKKDDRYKFLNFKDVDEFDELNKLFFRVLARQEKDRHESVQEHYFHIPYLNSSLFEPQDLEKRTIQISNLDDHAEMPLYGRTVLKDGQGKPLKESEGRLNTLQYLFRFLDAYDFSAEGKAEIQDDRKTLINASVLGLIFEKINGYKDGSFYTPGFVTEYMCRETLRKAVVEKFRQVLLPIPCPGDIPLPRGRGTEGEGAYRGMSAGQPATKLPESLIANARELRQNQTEAESLLWELLRNRQLQDAKFRRQHPIKEGIILDFYCHEARLAIEVDGGYHEEEEQKQRDEDRTEFLNSIGIRVIRFTNDEVLEETERVLEEIARALDPPSPQTPLPPTDEGFSLTDIYNAIGRDISIEEANGLINSITVCDPAVGSGHFLVSALNELIAIKSELGIFCDEEFKVFRYVNIEVENDELVVTHGDDELFEYEVKGEWKDRKIERSVNRETQRLQKALFHEKKQLIENNLFGVDINPNSVKICRLRLWIELLKHAYYTEESRHQHLQVLPNIDINIKQGNSLVSRFALDSDLSSVFKDSEHSLEDYKEAVRSYKHTGDRAEKQRLQRLIGDIKAEYNTTLTNNRPINKKLSKQRGRLELMQNADLFGDTKFTKKEVKAQEQKVRQLEEQKAEEESGAFYRQAFEWRFEFPEVLDREGRFTGFDVVVENPPYIPLEQISEVERDYYRKYFKFVERKFETSVLFFLRSFEIGKEGSNQMFIAPLTWETGENYRKFRKHLFNTISIEKIINLPFDIFEDAYVETGIFHFKVESNGGYYIYIFDKKEKVESLNNVEFTFIEEDLITHPDFKIVFDPLIATIVNRIDDSFIPLGDITISTQGLSGSRYDGKSEPKDKSDYPYLDEGQAYNYQLIIDKITYTSMSDKENLKRFYEAEPKLLIRRIVNRRDRLDVGYTEKKLVYKKDINPFVIKDTDFLPKYVLGVMASKFISFLYVNTSSIATKDDFRQTTLTELRSLPIPKVEKEKQKEIACIADQILTAKRDGPEADTSKLEAEIDRLVYELYGLTEEEIGIVEENIKS